MKKFLKKILILLSVTVLIATLFSFTTSAAISTSVKTSAVSIGDKVTFTISASSQYPITYFEGLVQYDSSILNIQGSNGKIKFVEENGTDSSGNYKKSFSYSLVFETKKTGVANITLLADGTLFTYETSSGSKEENLPSNISKTVTVKDKQLSSNANMKSLSVRCLDANNKEISCKMTPSFSKNTTEYTVNVPNSVVKCLLNGEREEGNPSDWSVEGSANMKVGKNVRKVIVTAPSGAQKVYTININRGEEAADTPLNPDVDTPVSDTENPLEIQIDNTKYIIATDISAVKLFKGFEASTTDFKGQEISVARDKEGNFELFYLYASDSDVLTPYTYDKKNDTFKKLNFISQNDITYIVQELPLQYFDSQNYFTTNAEINGVELKCYQSKNSKLSDFYYLYCFNGENFDTYRYDSREGVLQRYPEMTLGITATDSETSVKANNTPEILQKFNLLDHNAKILVITFIVAIIIAIALVILLLIKLFTRNKYRDILDEDVPSESFDEVTINDDFLISDEKSDNTDDTF